MARSKAGVDDGGAPATVGLAALVEPTAAACALARSTTTEYAEASPTGASGAAEIEPHSSSESSSEGLRLSTWVTNWGKFVASDCSVRPAEIHTFPLGRTDAPPAWATNTDCGRKSTRSGPVT